MKHILIVDDTVGWINYHKEILEEIIPESEIITATSAEDGYNKILENIKTPFNIIITDLQMEDKYAPLYAGEWLVEQVQMLSAYYKAKIVIISGTSNIRLIANNYGVDCIPKSTALNFPESYNILNE